MTAPAAGSPRVLLVRTDRLGDVVLTAPAVAYLRRRFPGAHVTMLVRPYVAPLLRCLDGVDSIVLYRPDGEHGGLRGHLRLARQLRDARFDRAVVFHPRAELAFALRAAGIPDVAGTAFRWYSFLFTHRVPQRRRGGGRHEVDCNLDLLARALGDMWSGGGVEFGFRDGPLRAARRGALSALALDGPYAVVHPGSGGSAPRLPVDGFIRVVRHLLERRPALSVVVAGGADERETVDRVFRGAAAPDRVRAVTHWDLPTYAAVLAGASLVASNSTGPLHLARAFGTPVVGIYCLATPCHPDRWGPYGWPDAAATPDPEGCRTGRGGRCVVGNCLGSIPWERIRTAVDRQLDGRGRGVPPEGSS